MRVEYGIYEKVKPANPFDEIVYQMLNNDGASVTLTVTKDDVKKTIYKLQRAANRIDRTARLQDTTSQGDTVSLTFTLTKKFVGRWK